MNVLELTLCNPLIYSDKEDVSEEPLLDSSQPSSPTPHAPAASAAPQSRGLPVGTYLFAQTRENQEPDYWRLMAAEAQKYALQKQILLENRLFVRTLFEDGKKVVQVFIPIIRKAV